MNGERSSSRPDGLVWSDQQGGDLRAPHQKRARAKGAPPGQGAPQRGAAGQGRGQDDDVLRVRRESKGRRGKTVTVISGAALSAMDEAERLALARELKRRCASGGKAREGTVEIQGDHLETLLAELEARGFRAKHAGG